MGIFATMADRYDLKNDMTVGSLARFPEVITADEVQVDEDDIDIDNLPIANDDLPF